jgi:NADPH-dependent 7-cyano-7-deazaguanine reductase QueF
VLQESPRTMNKFHEEVVNRIPGAVHEPISPYQT